MRQQLVHRHLNTKGKSPDDDLISLYSWMRGIPKQEMCEQATDRKLTLVSEPNFQEQGPRRRAHDHAVVEL